MRYLPEVLLWAAAGLGAWLLTLSSVSTPELVTAAAAAVPCAVLAVLARRAVGRSWPAPPAWARWLLPLVVAVVADTVRVLGLAVGVLVGRRIPEGELRPVRLRRDGPEGRWRARQAVAVGVVTSTPGTVVVDVGSDSGRLLLHALGSGRPRLEEVVRR